MNRETKRFTEYVPGRTMGQDERSDVFDWDFPERELSYQELSGYGTPSEYSRFSGSDSPLSQRKLLAWLNAPSSEGVTGRRPQESPFHTGLSWRNYGTSPGRTIDPVTVGSSPEENFRIRVFPVTPTPPFRITGGSHIPISMQSIGNRLSCRKPVNGWIYCPISAYPIRIPLRIG